MRQILSLSGALVGKIGSVFALTGTKNGPPYYVVPQHNALLVESIDRNRSINLTSNADS